MQGEFILGLQIIAEMFTFLRKEVEHFDFVQIHGVVLAVSAAVAQINAVFDTLTE